MSSTGPTPSVGRRDDRGSGLLSTVIGVACVAALLGLAVNLTLGLWVRSTSMPSPTTLPHLATTYDDGERAAAASDIVHRAKDSLGPYGAEVVLDVESLDGDSVVLRVRAPGVSLLPAMVDGGPTVGAIDRRIVVRTETP
jgi:hypothetical protein